MAEDVRSGGEESAEVLFLGSSVYRTMGSYRKEMKNVVQTGVICVRRVAARVKGTVYNKMLRPVSNWETVALTGDLKVFRCFGRTPSAPDLIFSGK